MERERQWLYLLLHRAGLGGRGAGELTGRHALLALLEQTLLALALAALYHAVLSLAAGLIGIHCDLGSKRHGYRGGGRTHALALRRKQITNRSHLRGSTLLPLGVVRN